MKSWGVFMRLGSPGDTFDELEPFDTAGVVCDPKKIRIGHQGCCSINDAADAREVSAQLGVTFYVCNFKKDFGRIIDYFVDEYEQGRTPNPCVRCNDWLKFGKLHEYAKSIGTLKRWRPGTTLVRNFNLMVQRLCTGDSIEPKISLTSCLAPLEIASVR